MPAVNIFLHFETPVRAIEPKRWPHRKWSTTYITINHWPRVGPVITAVRGPQPCNWDSTPSQQFTHL